MNVSNSINGRGVGGESILNTPRKPSKNRGGFWSAIAAACAEQPGDSEILVKTKNCITVWKCLTDEEFDWLTEQYEAGSNMDEEQYKNFLNDLEALGSAGAANPEEAGVYCISISPANAHTGRENSYGVTGYLCSGAGWRQSLSRLAETMQELPEEMELFGETLDGTELDMDALLAPRIGKELKDLMGEATVSNSEFWSNLRGNILERAKENEALRKEEEEFQLLRMVLDNMTGRNDPRVSAAAGVRLGMDADQDAIESGYLPTELHTYLLSLSGKAAGVPAEEPEEQEEPAQQRIQAVQEAAAEKLYANSEERRDLADGDLAELARKYDPNHMSREEYDSFLEDMVRLHVASQEVIERIGYHGLTAAYHGEEAVAYVPRTPDAPAFQRSPIDGDIEGWIKNRMLWKPGITRESAKRGGLSNQYELMIEEEKTLSRIAEVLADVKRQRYPSISL